MVAGTSIGGGMLALPSMAAQMGYSLTVLSFLACWGVMYLSAINMMQATLLAPPKSHFLSISLRQLGPYAMSLTGLVYLALLLCLNAGYLDGLRQILGSPSASLSDLIMIGSFFGLIILLGYRAIDWANRGLMVVMVFSFIILVGLLSWVCQPGLLVNQHTHLSAPLTYPCLQLMITSFGYQIIIPSIAQYVDYKKTSVHKAIIFGSLITLAVYFIWITLIMAYIPQAEILSWQGNVVQKLIEAMPKLSSMLGLFSAAAIATSFLGVSLCLLDFLADGLKHFKCQRSWLTILVNIPAITMVYWGFKFTNGLAIGGIFVALLLILLPALLNWRTHYKLPNLVLILLSCWIVITGIMIII